MESNVLSSVASSAPKSPISAAFRDASQEFRYVIMRSLRLVMACVFEALTIVGTLVSAAAGLVSVFYVLTLGWLPVGAKDWEGSSNILMSHPLMLAMIAIPLTFFALTQWLAITMPYHLDTTMPGLRTKKCWHCEKEIPDYLRCVSCGAFRLGRLVTGGLWGVSLMITMLFLVHDLIGTSLIFYKTPGMKS